MHKSFRPLIKILTILTNNKVTRINKEHTEFYKTFLEKSKFLSNVILPGTGRMIVYIIPNLSMEWV